MAKEKEEIVFTGTKEERHAQLRAKFEKDYGKGTVMFANEKPTLVDVISTGGLGLDRALGVGGLPRGRIIEIYGPEASGKTTVCQSVIAEAHKNPDSLCAIIDAEHALDMAYAKGMGIDLDRLEISQPDYGEQALEVARMMIKSGIYDVIVVDSVAALVPKAELAGEIGDSKISLQARMMSQALRILTADVSHSNTVLIFTNQLRDKIGVMFGNPETTTGGNALKFYCSVRLDIRRIQQIKEGEDDPHSNRVKVKVIKNKVAPPFKSCEFNIRFGEGIDKPQEILDMAVDMDIIHKSGSWFSYEENKIGQGESSVRTLLVDNNELLSEIEQKVLENIAGVNVEEFVPDEEDLKQIEETELA